MNKKFLFLISSIDDIAIGIVLMLILFILTDIEWWIFIIMIFVLVGMILVKLYLFLPHFKKPSTGEEGMIGKIGKTLEPLNPSGQVKISGEIWKATSTTGIIYENTDIEVVDINGLELLVRHHK
jgi:membrane-bound serine protease (ClpP class)